MKLPIDMSGQLVWVIANTEAYLAGSRTIQPIHFWLGILKLIDKNLPKALDALELTGRKRGQTLRTIRLVRGYLEITEERATRLRRALRKKLRQGVVIDEPDKVKTLHRSVESREVFDQANKIAEKNEAQTVSAFHLTRALFDTGHITFKDFRSGASSKRGP
jgi:hypothetical protein